MNTMIHKFTSSLIFDGNQLIDNKVIIINDIGEVLQIDSVNDHDSASVKNFEGLIAPGFVNTHCHLELSHMRGVVDTGTTLLPFIEGVVSKRGMAQEIIDESIILADKEMQEAGIVACGDISNQIDTNQVKVSSPIKYYTFIEYFDMMHPDYTVNTIMQYDGVFDKFIENDKNKKSKVPHAPYSVTKSLFNYLSQASKEGQTISIHSEETIAEMELFYSKSGGFIELFGRFGVDFNELSPINKSSIHHSITHMNNNSKTLFVHNTLTDLEGIKAANEWSDKVYWATCPNANLYIENRLPNYKLFVDQNQKMTIGTDSLTSNWQLSIWEEIKTIKKYCSYLPLIELLKWGTYNGAEALGYESEIGSIKVGKMPGFVRLPIVQMDNNDLEIIKNKTDLKLKIEL
jgi:aminodeoxyfutalosine deaminase